MRSQFSFTALFWGPRHEGLSVSVAAHKKLNIWVWWCDEVVVHVGFVCALAVNLLGCFFFVVVDAGSGLVLPGCCVWLFICCSVNCCVPFVVLVFSVFVVAMLY